MLENMIKKVIVNDYIKVLNDNNESMGSYKGHLLLDPVTKQVVTVVEHEIGLVRVNYNNDNSVSLNGGILASKIKEGLFLGNERYIVLSKEKIIVDRIDSYKGEVAWL